MENPSRHTLGDYCRCTNTDQISWGFQPTNPMTFDIKNFVLQYLRDNMLNGQAIHDPWEHLAMFYEICSMCKLAGADITNDQVKFCIFGFSLIGRAKDWLQYIPNRMIQTWKELEDKFLERY